MGGAACEIIRVEHDEIECATPSAAAVAQAQASLHRADEDAPPAAASPPAPAPAPAPSLVVGPGVGDCSGALAGVSCVLHSAAATHPTVMRCRLTAC